MPDMNPEIHKTYRGNVRCETHKNFILNDCIKGKSEKRESKALGTMQISLISSKRVLYSAGKIRAKKKRKKVHKRVMAGDSFRKKVL